MIWWSGSIWRGNLYTSIPVGIAWPLAQLLVLSALGGCFVGVFQLERVQLAESASCQQAWHVKACSAHAAALLGLAACGTVALCPYVNDIYVLCSTGYSLTTVGIGCQTELSLWHAIR